MKLQAWFSEWEDQQYDKDGHNIGGCVSYPVEITDEHTASSYGQPLIVINGEPHGWGDMPAGQLQVPDPELLKRLVDLGYDAVEGRGADDAVRTVALSDAEDADGHPLTHWHPAAVILVY